MALISCPDCNKDVSSNAPTCPGCGAPIAAARESTGSGVAQLSTIQETSKKLKAHSLLSFLAFAGGLIGIYTTEVGSGVYIFFAIMMFVGMFWYLATKLRVWWHHK
jgi:hypothetical protein